MQKLNYIHANPVVAEICTYPEDYGIVQQPFMKKGLLYESFLTHYNA